MSCTDDTAPSGTQSTTTFQGAKFCANCDLENTISSCVSGTTIAECQTNDPTCADCRYATTDWAACSSVQLNCLAGQQPDQTLNPPACVECSTVGTMRNLASVAGISCVACDAGKEPNRVVRPGRVYTNTECIDCAAGKYSPFGACQSCSTMGSQFHSGAAATTCTACGSGRAPNSDRSVCDECLPGRFSTSGMSCQACSPGKQSSSDRVSCTFCATVSPTSASPNGVSCDECVTGKQPNAAQALCEDCPVGTLGFQGTCAGACQTLGCANFSLSAVPGSSGAVINSLGRFCGGLSAGGWLAVASGNTKSASVASSTAVGACNVTSCHLQVAAGITDFLITATDGTVSSTCPVRVEVRQARITVTPSLLEISTLNTGTGEATLQVLNDGSQSVGVNSILFNETWVSVTEIRDQYGVIVTLPRSVAPGSRLFIVVTGEGTAVPPSAVAYAATATVVAQSGLEVVTVAMTVTEATLRVLALPAVISAVRMSAGATGASASFNVYNVDQSKLYWWMAAACDGTQNASTLQTKCGACGGDPTYHFTSNFMSYPGPVPGQTAGNDAFTAGGFPGPCASLTGAPSLGSVRSNCSGLPSWDYGPQGCGHSEMLDLGQSVPVTIHFTAPAIVGEYVATHTIYAVNINGEESSWNIQSTIQVSASSISISASTARFDGSTLQGQSVLVAGSSAPMYVVPRDAYRNIIDDFTLDFTATATTGSESHSFTSTYSFDVISPTHKYSLPIQLMKQGSYTIVATQAIDTQPLQTLNGVYVDIVTCADGSAPNVEGNACLCAVGYARTDGVCATCAAGTQPKTDREQGCESCRFSPGTISVQGTACEPCPVGLRPNVDTYAECVPCPAHNYYDTGTGSCVTCAAGSEINTATPVDGDGDGELDPQQQCVPCSSTSFRATTMPAPCDACDDGKQPQADRLGCTTCPSGMAGIGGICTMCEPGKAPDTTQTSCEACLPQTYRNNEPFNSCKQCPPGMTSDVSSQFVTDCRCPEGTYDGQTFNSDGQEVWAPVWCWPAGITSRTAGHEIIHENKLSLASEEAAKQGSVGRCVTCPLCLDCGITPERPATGGCLEAPDPNVCIESQVPEGQYRGNPYTLAEWTVADNTAVGLVSPDSHATSLSRTKRLRTDEDTGRLSRDVFKCPYESACMSEVEFRNDSTYVCVDGYINDGDGGVCGTCDDGWAAGKTGCTKCENVGSTMAVAGGIVLVIVGLVVLWKQRKKSQQQQLQVDEEGQMAQYLSVAAHVLPSLMGDIRVFVGVYQTLTNMGSTLSMTFPSAVEDAIGMVKEIVNVDVFSFGAVGCVAQTNYYGKLWAGVAVPAGLELAIFLMYKRHLKLKGLDKLHVDAELELEARSHLEQTHQKQRQARQADKDVTVDITATLAAKEEAADHHDRAFEDNKKLRRYYKMVAEKSALEQAAVGWSFFLIFLVYPSVTNKIFGFFDCYRIDDNTAFMMGDYSISCEEPLYYLHWVICVGGVLVIPVGIPTFMGFLVFKARKDILEDKGPHHLENLYKDYKKDCCMWEIYQMFQKVSLIGLLTFVDRGSILQCLVGLMICNSMLLAMYRDWPYDDYKTNILALAGQAIVVLSFLSALLLRVDLSAEAFTVDMIGFVILASNIPMMGYLIYDTYATMKEEIHAATRDLITAELGYEDAEFTCIKDTPMTADFKVTELTPVLCHVHAGDEFIKLEAQFVEASSIARIRVSHTVKLATALGGDTTFEGWVTFNEGGITGDRYFLKKSDPKAPPKAGKVKLRVNKHGAHLVVTVLCAKDLKDVDLGKNDDYVVVIVNESKQQKTSVLDNAGANPIWGAKGEGESLVFPNTPTLSRIHVQCWDEDKGEDDLIGECLLPLDDIVDRYREDRGEPWTWTGWRVVREVNGDLAQLMDFSDSDDDGFDVSDITDNPLAVRETSDPADSQNPEVFDVESNKRAGGLSKAKRALQRGRDARELTPEVACDKTIQVVAPGIVRKTADINSKKKGQLAVGTRHRVVRESKLADGSHRMQLDTGGWISVKAKHGQTLVEIIGDREVSESHASASLLEMINDGIIHGEATGYGDDT